ncbi:hypothetical protein ABK905_22060 [Acerihabitans sp. KWT182]|uniref:Uncharacterized protein n=1 Tax=Acerihabitans sp. KWT182 TaxID=3157919 RepID=A0AAU7Q7K7_9GAMM
MQDLISLRILQKNTVEVIALAGDLLTPVLDINEKIDLIYENLPNIPTFDNIDVEQGQNSSTYIEKRNEFVPSFISKYLITLHYLALIEAKKVISSSGDILSVIGGRIPIKVMLETSKLAGYTGAIHLITWKKQSEPEDVINGYLEWENEGYGPFHFYPIEKLEEVFHENRYYTGNKYALEIEEKLSPFILSPQKALSYIKHGKEVGHTVVVLRCTLK